MAISEERLEKLLVNIPTKDDLSSTVAEAVAGAMKQYDAKFKKFEDALEDFRKEQECFKNELTVMKDGQHGIAHPPTKVRRSASVDSSSTYAQSSGSVPTAVGGMQSDGTSGRTIILVGFPCEIMRGIAITFLKKEIPDRVTGIKKEEVGEGIKFVAQAGSASAEIVFGNKDDAEQFSKWTQDSPLQFRLQNELVGDVAGQVGCKRGKPPTHSREWRAPFSRLGVPHEGYRKYRPHSDGYEFY